MFARHLKKDPPIVHSHFFLLNLQLVCCRCCTVTFRTNKDHLSAFFCQSSPSSASDPPSLPNKFSPLTPPCASTACIDLTSTTDGPPVGLGHSLTSELAHSPILTPKAIETPPLPPVSPPTHIVNASAPVHARLALGDVTSTLMLKCGHRALDEKQLSERRRKKF